MLRIYTVTAASLALIVSVEAAPKSAKPPANGDEKPVLISTTGGGPKWKNPQELRAYADKGEPRACFELGERLLLGNGTEQNFAEGRAWLEKAAKAGVADAWFRLGKMHADGLGVVSDPVKAHECFLEAAKCGVPEAMHNVGAALVSGRGVSRDYTEGLAWLIVATKSGVSPDSERRTREHLAKRPTVIAAAEKRALELLKTPPSADPASAPAVSTKVQPTATSPTPPPPAKAKIDLGATASPSRAEIKLPKPEGE